MINANALRKKYLDFFVSKKHTLCKSDTLVPSDDPTILFTGAGMNQFKEYFLGKKKDMARATSCQKCLRTGDLDNVGKTAYHHTFFEMLGNFSFGDYFKKETITWAWEFLTEDLNMSAEKLWVTVYKDDEEAYAIWANAVKIPVNKIIRLGDKDNFWPANAIKEGPNGPCGPCSEIFYDRGESKGCKKKDCSPACDCKRFVEIWNLVFTQYNRLDNGELTPLPAKNIDTGMGFERMLSVLQNKDSNYDTDLFAPINAEIETVLAANGIKPSESMRPEIHAIADHIRAVVFMICDGVMPSNEEKGYVVRMLIRRSARLAAQIGITEPFFASLTKSVSEAMGEQYPEITERVDAITQIIALEEDRFAQTLESGSSMLDELMKNLKKNNLYQIPGDEAFKLYDTYGFPLELTQLVAEQKGFTVDKKIFKEKMEKQKELSRVSSNMKGDVFGETFTQKLNQDFPKTEFVGYEENSCETQISGIFIGTDQVKTLTGPSEAVILLRRTPFYGEGGGQSGDTGTLKISGKEAAVTDTQKTGGYILHCIRVPESVTLNTGDKVTACVNYERRLDIARNHTATHILQAALREELGAHIQQAGSRVSEKSLTFDFYNPEKLTDETLGKIEYTVNMRILANEPVTAASLTLEEAKKEGALAFFGEKYSDIVRMLKIGEYSTELCAGTHLKNTGEIGSFRIISESSIASGVRRIEALTGRGAYGKMKNDAKILSEISSALKAPAEKIPSALENLIKKNAQMNKELRNKAISDLSLQAKEAAENIVTVNGINLLLEIKEGFDGRALRSYTDQIKSRIKDALLVIISKVADGKNLLLVTATPDALKKRQIHCGNLLKDIASAFNGKGGGAPNMAQGSISGAITETELLDATKTILNNLTGK